MNRLVLIFIVLTHFIYSCTNKPKPAIYEPGFTSFEISFHPGMGQGFSFLVDSNKTYFSSIFWDTCFYGILPDTILQSIDSFTLKLQKGNVYKTIDKHCDDCSNVAIKVIIGKDTIQIHQLGNIDKSIYLFIELLEKYIKQNKHKVLSAWLLLETNKIVSPLPPKIEKNKYEPK